MSLGLPSFSMIFSGKAVSAIERSARGIVAMILTDGTEGGKDLNIYKKVDEVDFQNWTEQNYNYLKLVFAGAPSTVITIRRAENAEGYNAELKKLKDLKWNYLTIPGLGSADTTTISAWIKQYRDDERKTFKAVLAHCKGDHEGIINLTTENISTTITGAKHTAAEYNIGRGVNSLVSFTTEKTEDVRFIKIVEGMDLYMDDIRETYEESYVGKIINDYDGKQMFVAAIGAYHKGLLGNVLDKSYDNVVAIDIDAQRTYLESRGMDTSEMDDIAVAKANTGTKVFIASNVKFVNAMEDLKMNVNM